MKKSEINSSSEEESLNSRNIPNGIWKKELLDELKLTGNQLDSNNIFNTTKLIY